MLKAEQRPSKHVIVDASISYHKMQDARYHQAACVIQNLVSERDDLLRELNSLRSLTQASGWLPRQPRPIDPAVVAMLADKGAAPRSESEELASNDTIQQNELHLDTPGILPIPMKTSQCGALPLPPTAHSADDWSWSGPPKTQHQATSFSDIARGSSVFWDSPTEMITTTPPKDVEVDFGSNASHLIDNSAFFWTQHPGLNVTTPPGDINLAYNTATTIIPDGVPSLWPQNMVIPTTTQLSDEDMTSNNQDFQIATSYSHMESLSI